jgi:hypothetical protein
MLTAIERLGRATTATGRRQSVSNRGPWLRPSFGSVRGCRIVRAEPSRAERSRPAAAGNTVAKTARGGWDFATVLLSATSSTNESCRVEHAWCAPNRACASNVARSPGPTPVGTPGTCTRERPFDTTAGVETPPTGARQSRHRASPSAPRSARAHRRVINLGCRPSARPSAEVLPRHL